MDLTGLMRLWRHEGIMTVVLLLWSKVNFRPASCFRPWAPRSCRHSHHRRSVSQASRGLLQWHHRNGSSSSVGTNDAAQIDTWWLSVFPSAAMLMTIHEVRADSSFFGFITLRDSVCWSDEYQIFPPDWSVIGFISSEVLVLFELPVWFWVLSLLDATQNFLKSWYNKSPFHPRSLKYLINSLHLSLWQLHHSFYNHLGISEGASSLKLHT